MLRQRSKWIARQCFVSKAAICRFHFVALKNDKRYKQKILVQKKRCVMMSVFDIFLHFAEFKIIN